MRAPAPHGRANSLARALLCAGDGSGGRLQPEISLPLTEAIEVQLVDDWEAVTREQRVHPALTLPCAAKTRRRRCGW